MPENPSSQPIPVEQTEVVVVGSRCAGSAASIALASRGRRVVALERGHFPSDTLSTHLLFAGGVAEVKRLGALERVEAAGPPKLPFVQISAAGLHPRGRYTPVDGIDYGMCVRRPILDTALVETAREAGAEVRERCNVREVVWHGGRAAGVRYTDPDGELRELRAKLVIGADGRGSFMARQFGVETPYRQAENIRGLVWVYVEDPRPESERDAIIQWRAGDTLGMFFPTETNGTSERPGGLALFMPPKEDVAEFRKDPERMWAQKLAENPDLSERLGPTTGWTKQRSSIDNPGYFRVSSGPGWALAGDAGHFKDPVVAQGIRDALRFGRLCGEAAADALDDPEWLDRRLYRWELRRDRETLPTYYLGQKHSRTHPVSAVEVEAFRDFSARQSIVDGVADMFARTLSPQQALTLPRQVLWTLRALRRPGADRGAIVRFVADELRLDAKLRWDLMQVGRGRRAGRRPGSIWGRDGWTPKASSSATAFKPRPVNRPGQEVPEAETRVGTATETRQTETETEAEIVGAAR